MKLTSPGNRDIYSQRVGGSNSRNLTADFAGDDNQPAFSPDGSTIAFRSERDGGGIFLMGATGESVRRLIGFGFNPAWSPDGREVLVATEGVFDPEARKTRSEIWRIDTVTSARRRIVEGDAVQPSWSPHGQRIAYWGIPTGSAMRALWTVPADGGAPEPVVRRRVRQLEPRVVSRRRVSLLRQQPRRQHEPLADPYRRELRTGAGSAGAGDRPVGVDGACSSLARDGRRILYSTAENRANLERIPLGPGRLEAGELRPVTQGSRGVRSCDVSPDGRWLAFYSARPKEDLFVVGVDGQGMRQLTADAFHDRYPRWTPDGARLVFQSDRSGRYELWSVRADGGDPEQVTRSQGDSLTYPVFSPDGRSLALAVANRGAALLDLSLSLEKRKPAPLPPLDRAGQRFDAISWSRTGNGWPAARAPAPACSSIRCSRGATRG